jgi:hypothetical protein
VGRRAEGSSAGTERRGAGGWDSVLEIVLGGTGGRKAATRLGAAVVALRDVPGGIVNP